MKRKKLSWHFYLILLFVLLAAIAFGVYFSRKEEYACEMADLLVMQNAEDTALLLCQGRLPEQPEEYWYRPKDMRLIPVSEPMPAACGMGTKRRGGAVKAFTAETRDVYDYDEAEDYTDQSLHVTVSGDNGVLNVHVDWVLSENRRD